MSGVSRCVGRSLRLIPVGGNQTASAPLAPTKQAMLYKNYKIEIWKTEWVDKRIHGVNYSLDTYNFCGEKDAVKNHKYVALVRQVNPSRSFGIYGGSTPLIALDLAKFAIDLAENNRQRIEAKKKQIRERDEECLKKRLRL